MSGISQDVVFAVNRIKMTFVDQIGNIKNAVASGFWLNHCGENIFVTNKHNIDPALKLGNGTDFFLDELFIELRDLGDFINAIGEARELLPETKFFKVDMSSVKLKVSPDADTAIISDVTFLGEVEGYSVAKPLSSLLLAEGDFHRRTLQIMDAATFIGFPGYAGRSWADEKWSTGIARTVNIASIPATPYTHESIATGDVTLVSGLSFSGSSGSLVLSHEKGINIGDQLTGGNYSPPKIIGIMSGHWWGEEYGSGMFHHSGLSYYTRSISILSLLENE